MKKKLSLIVFAVFTSFISNAQMPDYMSSLVDCIIKLRAKESDEDVYNWLSSTATKWTLMDEIKTSEAECGRSKRWSIPHFGVNDMAYKIAESNNKKFTSAGNFCDGTDPRFNYSFIEKTIISGGKSQYEIPGRVGRQVFVIIPFIKKHQLEVSLQCMGEEHLGVIDKQGNIILEANNTTDKISPIFLSVKNNSSNDIAYVMINYNSRTH